MTIFLIRHASAGVRGVFDGDDHERPIDALGHDQAAAIADLLFDTGITHVASSAALRCMQTVEPLAEKLGIDIMLDAALAEGQSASRAVAEIRRLATEGTTAALCSHGDIIPDAIQTLARDGMDIEGVRGWTKGSTWRLDVVGGEVVSASFLGPF